MIEVAQRLLTASQMLPSARIVGINHWYCHAAPPAHERSVTCGLQHMTFQPMLLKLPFPLPPGIVPTFNYCDDDEFAWRVHAHYGKASVVKLRYIIAKFDIGCLDGGLQHSGIREAKAAQHAESEDIVQLHGDAFGMKCTAHACKGRLGGQRARLLVDQKHVSAVRIGGKRAGKVIEHLCER